MQFLHFTCVLFARYLFKDAEVKPFDPAQIAAECFGGEMTVSVYFISEVDECFN